MIVGFVVLLLCQLTGQFLATLFQLRVPGPVIGLALLLIVLQVSQRRGVGVVTAAADRLLADMQLFFIPAGVGVVQYLGVLGAAALPIVAGLLLSWAVALLVTGAAATVAFALTRRTSWMGMGMETG